MSQRIEWVDWVKTLAIFSVVWLHVHCNVVLDTAINNYVMPLFFTVSGYLFMYERNPFFKSFFFKRFRQLVVPYFWINILAFFLWLFILRHYGENVGDTIEWHTTLRAIFTGWGPLLVHDIPLWSLLSFFIVEIVFYVLGSLKLKWYVISVFSLALYTFLIIYLGPYATGHLPLVIGPSIAGLFFYSLGFGSRILYDRFTYHNIKRNILISIIAATIFAFSTISNGNISFYDCNIGNLPLFFISGVSGSIFFIEICKIISKISPSPFIIRFISIGTLLICGFHLIVFAFIKGIMLLSFGLYPESYIVNVISGGFFAIIILLLTLPIIYIIRKYFRFLVDK